MSGDLKVGGVVKLNQDTTLGFGSAFDGWHTNKLTRRDFDTGRRVVLDGGFTFDLLSYDDFTARVVTPFDANKVGIAKRLAYKKTATKLAGLDHLEGQTVTVVRTMDRATLGTTETAVVTNGEVALGDHALFVDVGRPYTCDLQLLPTTLQMAALGYGRDKSINRAWIRVFESRGLSVGASADTLAPVADLQNLDTLATRQTRNIVPADWSDDAQLLIRQSSPYPATVAAVTLEVSVAE